jgi:hypothetical protein
MGQLRPGMMWTCDCYKYSKIINNYLHPFCSVDYTGEGWLEGAVSGLCVATAPVYDHPMGEQLRKLSMQVLSLSKDHGYLVRDSEIRSKGIGLSCLIPVACEP